MKYKTIEYSDFNPKEKVEIRDSVDQVLLNTLATTLYAVSNKKSVPARHKEGLDKAHRCIRILHENALENHSGIGVIIMLGEKKYISLHLYGYVSPVYKTEKGAADFLFHADNIIRETIEKSGNAALYVATKLAGAKKEEDNIVFAKKDKDGNTLN